MKKLISPIVAGNISISILILLIIMHVLIILKVLPSYFVWGGQITDDASLYKLEFIALATIIPFLLIFMIKKWSMKSNKSQKIINVFLWLIFIWFLFNIIGNALSASTLEKILFIPISSILSLMSLRLALEK